MGSDPDPDICREAIHQMSGPFKGFSQQERFHQGDYYYNEEGYLVMTEQYLLRRGYCCKSGCKHCPYGFGPEGFRKEMEKRPKKRP